MKEQICVQVYHQVLTKCQKMSLILSSKNLRSVLAINFLYIMLMFALFFGTSTIVQTQ